VPDAALRDRFLDAAPFDEYLAGVVRNAEFWHGAWRTASVPGDLVARAAALATPWNLLVLSEDWCGDAVQALPVLARLAEAAGSLTLRVLGRDGNLDLMDAHLTLGTRSIPVVIALDEAFDEYGWWGPRPAPMQRWMRRDGLLLPKPQWSLRKRAWYARDRGRTILEGVLDMLERAERRRAERRSGASRATFPVPAPGTASGRHA
jgi:hypothetical protein